VDNLDKAVAAYREKGFIVEYGKLKNPYNALVYFSKGPYLELMASTGMPAVVKNLMGLFGMKKMAQRVDYWDNHAGGFCGLAFENYEDNLDEAIALLKGAGQKCHVQNNFRNDVHGRKLRFKVGFPHELEIPFFMTYFNIDPKPKDFVHPNGVAAIKSVRFGTKAEYIPLILKLCDDPMLTLYTGAGIGIELDSPGDYF